MKTNEQFLIQGLGGKRTLRGSISVNGAKNAVLKAMAASLLFDGLVTLENVPESADVITMNQVLSKLGCDISWNKDAKTLSIDPTKVNSADIDAELAGGMRSSVVVTGPLLARMGRATFPAPGGCVLGARPIDLFLKGYQMLGATVTEKDCVYDISAPSKLRGTEIFFDIQAVGPTETLMMAATLAHGRTVLKNCAMEPEIVNVAEWLNICGAKISGAGTPTITIEGTNGGLLKASAARFVTIPDRIEAGSFLILGALCAEELTITNCRPSHLESVISLLKQAGVQIDTNEKAGEIKVRASHSGYKAVNVRTHEYPGFPTDLQAPLVTFLTQAEGESRVVETIFEARFKYVEDLVRAGASIKINDPREIMVRGTTPLKGSAEGLELNAHDIRAGFAVVLAALVGEGEFKINNVNLIDRGYEKLEERLASLGARIRRI